MSIRLSVIVIVAALATAACDSSESSSSSSSSSPASTAAPAANPKVPAGAKSSGGMHAVIETDKGPIEIEFFAAEAPKTVENFRLLAEHGYYDGLTFHRIVRGFM